jgi:hypothetical protein
MQVQSVDEILKAVESSQGLQGRRRAPSHLAIRRMQLRDSLWPDAAEVTWHRKTNDGFATIPRVLPLVLHLIAILSKKGDGNGNPSSVYLELWAQAPDEMIVTIRDEAMCAYAAGYSGTRAERTWRERLLTLSQLGFVRVKPQGLREIGYVLLLNPLLVCARLRRDKPKDVPEEWWNAFLQRANEVGAKIPETSEERQEEKRQ